MPKNCPSEGAVERFQLFESMLLPTQQVVVCTSDDFRTDSLYLSGMRFGAPEQMFGISIRRFMSRDRHYIIPDAERRQEFVNALIESDLAWSVIDFYPYPSEGNA